MNAFTWQNFVLFLLLIGFLKETTSLPSNNYQKVEGSILTTVEKLKSIVSGNLMPAVNDYLFFSKVFIEQTNLFLDLSFGKSDIVSGLADEVFSLPNIFDDSASTEAPYLAVRLQETKFQYTKLRHRAYRIFQKMGNSAEISVSEEADLKDIENIAGKINVTAEELSKSLEKISIINSFVPVLTTLAEAQLNTTRVEGPESKKIEATISKIKDEVKVIEDGVALTKAPSFPNMETIQAIDAPGLQRLLPLLFPFLASIIATASIGNISIAATMPKPKPSQGTEKIRRA